MRLQQYLNEALDGNKFWKMIFTGINLTNSDPKNPLVSWYYSVNHYIGKADSGAVMFSKEKTPADEIWKRSNFDTFQLDYLIPDDARKVMRNWKVVAKVINREWDYDKERKAFVKK